MNYIKMLQNEVELHKGYGEALERGLIELLAYLESPKFHEDTTVQVMDVTRRIQEIRKSAVLSLAEK